MFKPIRSKIVAALVGLVVVAGSAAAVNTFYRGYNAATNQAGFQGLEVFGGMVPLVSGTSCGTLSGAVGGTSKGVITSSGPLPPPNAPGVNLGAASTFGVLAYSGITNTGATTIVGDIGSSPTNSITGFNPAGTFTGTNHGNDATSAAAQVALAAAIADTSTRTPQISMSADIGGQVLTPGYYKAASSLAITGTVTLDAQGNPNALFILQSPSSTLTTASNAVVLLANGAQAGNVFWVVGSSATLGIGTTFVGTILAQASITVNGTGTDNGRLLANTGAVTFATAETVNFDGSGAGSAAGCGTLTLTLPTPTIVVSSGLNNGKNAVNSAAVPNRLACSVKDLTTPSVMFLYSATPTATSCSLTSVSGGPGDLLEYRIEGY
jgi:hypothetical protein